MLKNYLKIAQRNLLKHQTYSIINIIGLAIVIKASRANPIEALKCE